MVSNDVHSHNKHPRLDSAALPSSGAQCDENKTAFKREDHTLPPRMEKTCSLKKDDRIETSKTDVKRFKNINTSSLMKMDGFDAVSQFMFLRSAVPSVKAIEKSQKQATRTILKSADSTRGKYEFEIMKKIILMCCQILF